MHDKELFDVTAKTAIVTGGGRGLGEQIAIGLAEAGANVWFVPESCSPVRK